MHRLVGVAALVALVAACKPEGQGDITGSTDKCITELYPSYDPKALDQCVAVCRRCQHGSNATCSTSCTLKGAR